MKRWKWVVSIMILLFLILLVTGFRFSALSAAESNSIVTKDYKLVEKYDVGKSKIFLFKSDKEKQYITVLSAKSGMLYQSNSSTYTPYHRLDSLQTIGGMSYSSDKNSFTFLCVKSLDDEVAYIEAGVQPNVQRKEVNKGEFVSFLFPFSQSNHLLNATAYDKNGNKLYYYGYPKRKAQLDDEDLKWHKINEE